MTRGIKSLRDDSFFSHVSVCFLYISPSIFKGRALHPAFEYDLARCPSIPEEAVFLTNARFKPSFLWRRLSSRASRRACKKFYWQFEGVRRPAGAVARKKQGRTTPKSSRSMAGKGASGWIHPRLSAASFTENIACRVSFDRLELLFVVSLHGWIFKHVEFQGWHRL